MARIQSVTLSSPNGEIVINEGSHITWACPFGFGGLTIEAYVTGIGAPGISTRSRASALEFGPVFAIWVIEDDEMRRYMAQLSGPADDWISGYSKLWNGGPMLATGDTIRDACSAGRLKVIGDWWVPIRHLRPGAIFQTRDGVRGVRGRAERADGFDCIMLVRGDTAFYGGDVEVREVYLPD